MRLLSYLVLIISLAANGQKQTDPAIMEPIKNLFLAMELGDSSKLHNSFFPDVTLITILEKEGETKLKKEGLQDFLVAVASPHDVVWHEPIWDVTVDQDGNFAQVWAKYAFYAGTKFSHCGVDTFQLVKTAEGWKIFYLADTRNRTGCNVPEAIVKQYTQEK